MNDKTIKDLHIVLLYTGVIIHLCGLVKGNIILLTGSIVPIFMGYISLEFSDFKKSMVGNQ